MVFRYVLRFGDKFPSDSENNCPAVAPNYALLMEKLEKYMAGSSFIDFYHKSCFELLYHVMLGATFLWLIALFLGCHSLTFRASRSHQKDRCWQYCSIIMWLDKNLSEKSKISCESMRCVTLIYTSRQGVMIKVAEHSDTNMSMNFCKSVGELDYVTHGCIILTFP